ncbi:MAG: LysM peptidoglycan-binding domain-containing protein [Lentisphaeria bacterium]|nr:LysM peptidoglycan-binding domain-containing protein [Lentisphaeria bacterium]
MSRFTIALGAGAAAVVVLAGCGPDLAEVPYGSEEARWQEMLRDNYAGYEAPRTAPPAVKDNVSPRLLEEEQKRKSEQNNVNPPPAAENPQVNDDPASVVDKAADRPAAVQEQPAAPEESKKAPEKAPAKDKAKAPEKAPAKDKAAPAKPAAKKDAAEKADVYVVQPKDTLGDLAKKFYGDARRSDVIVKANPELKKNPNFLKPGMKLVIPKI